MKILSLLIVIPLAWVFFFSTSLAIDVNDTDTVNISVMISSEVAVDVNPASLSWTGVEPGSVGGPNEETNGYFAIQIENIGSRNITHIWFRVSNPSERPFATGNATKYDAGNFVAIAREGSSNYYFPNRKEFNESRSLVYLKDFDGNMPPNSSKYVYGRFRNASKEYFWMIDRTGGDCANNNIRIGLNPHTHTSTGSTNFATGSGEYYERFIGVYNATWAYVDIDGGPFSGWCGAIPRPNCDYIILYKWDMDQPGAGTHCNNAEYFWSADSGDWPGFPLVPGNSTVANIRVFVPYGVYEGSVKQGTLTVYVNDA